MMARLFYSLIIFSVFSSFNSSENVQGRSLACDDIEMTLKTSEENNVINYSLEVKNAAEPIKYIFHDSDGNTIKGSSKSNTRSGLKKGKYTVLIYDNVGCNKYFEINVK